MIQFPSQPDLSVWNFFDFGYSSGGNPIEVWYEKEISDRARLAFDALLKNNIKTANHLQWLGMKKMMRGKLKGLHIWQWEIAGELQYRMLGSFWGQKRAVFLIGYNHKGDVYVPAGALETAIERKELLDQGACKLYERTPKNNL